MENSKAEKILTVVDEPLSAKNCKKNPCWLDGLGDNLFFPFHKEKKEERNSHLASIRGNDPTCSKFDGCPVVV